MTPNIVKGSNSLPAARYDLPNHPTNDDKYHPESYKQKKAEQDSSNSNMSSGGIDGDHSAKTMDAGANRATNAADMTDGLHEDAVQKAGTGEKATGQGTSVFSKDGAIGSQFTSQGNIGQIGEKIGGPLSSQGSIGQAFTEQGAIGGTFQKLAEKNEQH